MFHIDAADYMMSICGGDSLKELSSPGKSGSIFYLSQDERFVIKTLRKSELKVSLEIVYESVVFLFIMWMNHHYIYNQDNILTQNTIIFDNSNMNRSELY